MQIRKKLYLIYISKLNYNQIELFEFVIKRTNTIFKGKNLISKLLEKLNSETKD